VLRDRNLKGGDLGERGKGNASRLPGEGGVTIRQRNSIWEEKIERRGRILELV